VQKKSPYTNEACMLQQDDVAL